MERDSPSILRCNNNCEYWEWRYGNLGFCSKNGSLVSKEEKCNMKKKKKREEEIIKKDSIIIRDGYGEFELQSPVIDKFPKGSENFVHLHNHSEYSLLDGMSRIERGYLSIDMDTLYEGQKTLANRAKELKQPGIAMTDHGNMGGYFRFYAECLKNKINPIIGCEFYLVQDVKIKGRRPKERHIVLIAKNYDGIKQLFKLNKYAWTEGFYYRPHVDIKAIKTFCSGSNIIAMTACTKGILSSTLTGENKEYSLIKAKKIYDILVGMFGVENVYLEFMPHDFKDQVLLNKRLLLFSRKYKIENVVATNDCHYCEKEDEDPHEVLVCIQSRSTLYDENRFKFSVKGLYIKNREEMYSSFMKNHPKLGENFVNKILDNTVEINKQIHLEIPKRKNILPVPDLGEDKDSFSRIKKLVLEGWKIREVEKLVERYSKRKKISKEEARDVYLKRLKRELKVIKDLGFVDYFLVVKEIIDYARNSGIMVGPGRGSSASSLVCYLLGITTVDPIYYNLMFERFISYYKVTSPDIDIDFEDSRRDEIFDWAAKRWGENRVARIATYGVLKGRQVIKDVSRCFGVPYLEANQITKYVIQRSGGDARKSMTVSDSFEQFDIMKKYGKKYPQIKPNSVALEGTIRNAGIHACGFIIAPMDLEEIVPIETRGINQGAKRIKVVASTTKEAEALGLLKLDALGLKTLSVLKETAQAVENRNGVKIDLEKIKEDDEFVIEDFTKGDFTGIFQFDSLGMRRLTKDFVFDSFEDIINLTALYRPGTLRSGLSNKFISIRTGKKKIEKVHPIYDDITKHTAGIFIFQEQISEAFYRLAGYKLAAADQLRVAIAKSHGTEVINRQRNDFVKGCMEKGLDKDKSEKLFDSITQFGSYGFNKAHAAAYATISYWCAFLKHYFPIEFAVALLNHEKDEEKIEHYMKWCKEKKIRIESPDINKSKFNYAIGENGAVYVGLEKIKFVGKKAVVSIIKNQPYQDFFDFLKKVDQRVVNKRVIESLIKAGAFKSFCKDVKYLLTRYENYLNIKDISGIKEANIAMSKTKFLNSKNESLIRREVLILPEEGAIIDLYKDFVDKIRKFNPVLDKNFYKISEVKGKGVGNSVVFLAGEIIEMRYNCVGDFDKMPPDEEELEKRKNAYEAQGSRYCNVDLEDGTNNIRIVFKPIVFEKVKLELEEGKGSLIMVRGRKIKGEKRELFFAEEAVNLKNMERRIKEKNLSDRDLYFLKSPCYRESARKLMRKYNLSYFESNPKENKEYKLIGLVTSLRGCKCKNGSWIYFISVDGGFLGERLSIWGDSFDRYKSILENSLKNNKCLGFKLVYNRKFGYNLSGIGKAVVQ